MCWGLPDRRLLAVPVLLILAVAATTAHGTTIAAEQTTGSRDPACEEATVYLEHARRELVAALEAYRHCAAIGVDACNQHFADLEETHNQHEDAVNQFINNC